MDDRDQTRKPTVSSSAANGSRPEETRVDAAWQPGWSAWWQSFWDGPIPRPDTTTPPSHWIATAVATTD